MALSDVTEKMKALDQYSACDISDALLGLEKVEDGQRPLAGFLADIVQIAPLRHTHHALWKMAKTIAPASTVQFQAKLSTSESSSWPIPEPNIPEERHWVDLTKPDTVVIVDQPQGQHCAVMGGIMAARMKYLGAKAVIVTGAGRVRDMNELNSLALPIWGRATSTVGAGAEAKPYALDVPISVGALTIKPGDIVFCDPVEGVVVIPRDMLDAVLEILPAMVEADDRVKEDVQKGISVQEAFAKHRKGL